MVADVRVTKNCPEWVNVHDQITEFNNGFCPEEKDKLKLNNNTIKRYPPTSSLKHSSVWVDGFHFINHHPLLQTESQIAKA